MATLNDNITRVNNTLKDIQNAINNSDIVSVDKPSDYANAINIINTYANDSIDMVVSDDTFISRITAEGCSVVNESQAKINYIGGNSEVSENLIVFNDKTQYKAGLTAKVENGIITINGTTTTSAEIKFEFANMIPKGEYSINTFNPTNETAWIIQSNIDDDISLAIKTKHTFTLSQNAYKIKTWFPKDTTLNNYTIKLMLVKGSTAPTEFKQGFLGIRNATPNKLVSTNGQETNEIDIPLYSELLSAGNVRDKYYPNGNLVRNVGSVTLNGSENWSLQSINSYSIANFSYGKIIDYVYNEHNALCDKFSRQITSIAQTTSDGYLLNNLNQLYIRIDSSKANSVEAFKAYLQSNPITINYELATPIVSQAQVWQDNIKVYKGGTETFEGTKIGINLNSTYAISKLEVVANVNEND